MKTRKQKQRKQKQKGGNLETLFPSLYFTLQTPLKETGSKVNDAALKKNMNTWTNAEKALFHKKHLLTLYEKKKNAEPVKLCTLYFIPHFEGTKLAYLDNLDCYAKTSAFKPISFIIVYKFLQILQSLGIEYVFFSVAAMGNSYYKLFQLYHSMGFVCKPNPTDLNLTNNKILQQYLAQRELNTAYFAAFPSRNTKQLSVTMEMFARCTEMYGHVPSVLAKIESYFPSIAVQSHESSNGKE